LRSSQHQQREVRWWMHFDNNENLKLIDSHPKAITGMYTYIGAGIESSGGFSCPHNASFLRAGFAPFWARGLTVTPAFSLSNASVISGSALKHLSEACCSWFVRFAEVACTRGRTMGVKNTETCCLCDVARDVTTCNLTIKPATNPELCHTTLKVVAFANAFNATISKLCRKP
jgi:hypothetical protein